MESFSFELIEAIVRKCSKKGGFEILEELIRKHSQWNTTSDNRMQFAYYARRHQTKNYYENCAFDVMDVHMYALCSPFMFAFFCDKVRSKTI